MLAVPVCDSFSVLGLNNSFPLCGFFILLVDEMDVFLIIVKN